MGRAERGGGGGGGGERTGRAERGGGGGRAVTFAAAGGDGDGALRTASHQREVRTASTPSLAHRHDSALLAPLTPHSHTTPHRSSPLLTTPHHSPPLPTAPHHSAPPRACSCSVSCVASTSVSSDAALPRGLSVCPSVSVSSQPPFACALTGAPIAFLIACLNRNASGTAAQLSPSFSFLLSLCLFLSLSLSLSPSLSLHLSLARSLPTPLHEVETRCSSVHHICLAQLPPRMHTHAHLHARIRIRTLSLCACGTCSCETS